MKFSGRQDIEAPVAEVFRILSDFETVERSAIRRGVEISRSTDSPDPCEGMRWDVTFLLRGRTRTARLRLDRLAPPEGMSFSITSPSIEGALEVGLVALSPQRTRMTVGLDIRPRTMTGRLLVQSMRLARKKLDRQFRQRVRDYGTFIGERAAGRNA